MSTKEQGGLGIAEKEDVKKKEPKMFNVVMKNDDYTPMEFVTFVLTDYFNKNLEQAVQLMLKVHNEGAAVAGIYTLDIAKTKTERALDRAKKEGHPFQLDIQPA